jgi:hypothetical protein
MKKIILGLAIAALTAGVQPVFAAESEARHQLDDQKKQAKLEYEQQRDQLKRQYTGDELEQRLQQAYSDYKAKTKMLDQQKKVGDDPGEAIPNNQ